jgi:hypothetical protein
VALLQRLHTRCFGLIATSPARWQRGQLELEAPIAIAIAAAAAHAQLRPA